MQIAIGFTLGALIGFLAWRARALSASGAWAAMLTGGLIFGFGGLSWAALLLFFFISSSAWSRLFRLRKASLDEKFAKGSQRDWGQVLANGGLGALLALAHAAWPAAGALWWVAYAGALAAVNADTWATELGVLARSAPRLITTGQAVARGTSGGVTWAGSLAAAAGALGVAGLAALLDGAQAGLLLLICAWAGGLAGALFDSWLGATVQAMYFCPHCQQETERHPQHSCGSPTRPLRGWAWLGNDWVNGLCSLCGAGLAAGLWLALA